MQYGTKDWIERLCDRYDAFVFDVDGTLYRQTPVRIGMARQMMRDGILRPSHMKHLLALLSFRKRREKDRAFQNRSLEEQVGIVAEEKKIQKEAFGMYIRKWMFERPLELIKTNRRKVVCDLLHNCRRMKKTVVIYSDYPAEDKLHTLDIHYDKLFYPGNGIPDELKPSRAVMDVIISEIKTEKNRIIFVGDRDEKDGKSAALAGIDYLNVRQLKMD